MLTLRHRLFKYTRRHMPQAGLGALPAGEESRGHEGVEPQQTAGGEDQPPRIEEWTVAAEPPPPPWDQEFFSTPLPAAPPVEIPSAPPLKAETPVPPKAEMGIHSANVNQYADAGAFARMTGMNQPIILVSGSKGGVGKSLTAMALLDYYSANHKYLKLIDADTNNPDVWRCYGRSTEGEVVDLDDVEGWIRLVNICDATPFKSVVVNTPAQSNMAVSKNAQILVDSLRELGRPLITLWVINRQRDSLELLKDYLQHMNGGVVHVVCNGYFGEERKFELYRDSALRESVTALGGKSVYLPDLADRVTDELYGKRTTLSDAAQQFKLGDRSELQRWRTQVAAMFGEIGV